MSSTSRARTSFSLISRESYSLCTILFLTVLFKTDKEIKHDKLKIINSEDTITHIEVYDKNNITYYIKEEDIDERQLVKVEAIIRSMTKKEKRNPDILNASRRKRIAAGSGTTVQDVNKLMKQFEEMRIMMKKLGGKGKKGIGKKMLGGKMPNIFM